MALKAVALTKTDGKHIAVNIDAIAYIENRLDDEQTLIQFFDNDNYVLVKESYVEVLRNIFQNIE